MNRKERRKALVGQQLSRDAAEVQASSLPRTIGVLEFTQARLQEIASLKSALDNKIASNRRAMQDLPRHLRRRASSHNIHRLPSRLRARAQAEVQQQAPKTPASRPLRRERRRRSRMMQDHERRARRHAWLETHLWHAKRMRMENIWGHRLALHPTDKGQRATYKAALHFATLYDASASCCLQIDGIMGDIIAGLQPLFSPQVQLSLNDSRRRTVMLYESGQYPNGALAPCDFIWKPASPSDSHHSLWIWLHPSVASYISALIRDCFLERQDITVQVADLVKFELLGSRCQPILTNCLRPALPCSETKQKLWRALGLIRSQSSLPSGVCLGLDVTDPRSFSTKQNIALSYPEGNDNRIHLADASLEELICKWPAQLAASSLWTEQERIKATDSLSDTNNATVPVILIQRRLSNSRANSISGFDLVIPKGWAMAFWKSLIYAGCRAIGLEDRKNLHLEQGCPYFPDDYPDTAACAMQVAHSAHSLALKHARTPKAKRVNFEANQIPSPFCADWSQIINCNKLAPLSGDNKESNESLGENSELAVVDKSSVRPDVLVARDIVDLLDLPTLNLCITKTLIRVVIELRWGGVPHDNALVHLATKDECDFIESGKWAGLGLEPSLDRPVIAIVNRGGFLYSSGSGIGYGFASVSALQNHLSTDFFQSAIVLLRNTTSKHFHPALMRLAL